MAYDPVANLNLLQKLGMVLQSTATGGQSLQPILQQQMQARDLESVGNILAGSGIPEYALKEQTPQQIEEFKRQRLAALGTPTAFQALQNLQEREITPYQQAQLDLERKKMALDAENTRVQRDLLRQQKEDIKEEKRAVRAQGYAEKLSKRIEDTGIADIFGSLQKLDNILPKEGNVEGVGFAGGFKPISVLSESGKEIQQEVAQIQNSILKARSGGAVTESEAQRLLKELGTGAFSSEEQLRRGLNNVKRTFENKLKQIEAGYSEDAREFYRETGGISSSSLGGINYSKAASNPEQLAGARQIGKSGGRPVYQTKDGRTYIKE